MLWSVYCCGHAAIVENTGFKHMVRVLEPHYHVPSCVHFSQSVVPVLYNAAVVQE